MMTEAKKKTTKIKGKPQRLPRGGSRASASLPPKETAKKPERYVFAVGKRKSAIALVRLYSGKGPISVNGKSLAEYFPQQKLQEAVRLPFTETKTDSFRTEAKVRGGGLKGQAEALRLGIARALAASGEDRRVRLRAIGLLTRDSRVKERRKYGLKKARRAPQWQKR